MSDPDAPLLSVCLIAKDESARIARCLDRVAPVADEIVVADTGSTDDTASIARAHGARVVDVPWRDDFAAARNACLDAATGRWVLVVDADEFLEAARREPLHRMLRSTPHPAFSVEVVSPRGEGRVEVAHLTRLFRRVPEHRYEGRIHENVLGSICRALGRETWTPPRSGLRLEHEGYSPELRAARNKLERNRRLLLAAIDEHPDDPGPRFLFARENVAVAGGDLLDVPQSREALERLAPAVDGLLDAPRGVTDPAVALAIRLATVTGDGRVDAWSARLRAAIGDTARALYAEGERLLASALAGRVVDAPAAARAFRKVRAAAEGCPAIPTERELREEYAPARAALADLVAGDIHAALRLDLETRGRVLADAVLVRALAVLRTAGPGAAVPLLARVLQAEPQDPRGWLAMSVVMARAGDEARRTAMAATAARLAPGWETSTRAGIAGAWLAA